MVSSIEGGTGRERRSGGRRREEILEGGREKRHSSSFQCPIWGGKPAGCFRHDGSDDIDDEASLEDHLPNVGSPSEEGTEQLLPNWADGPGLGTALALYSAMEN